MKRYIALILLFVMLFSFSACVDGTEESNVSEEVSENSVASPEVSKPETSKNDDVSEDEVSKEPYVPDTNEHGAFRISSIDDVSDENGTRSYKVYAPYTDTYTIEGNGVSNISIISGDTEIASGTVLKSVPLTENEVYTLSIKAEANADFTITVTADNHLVTLPYDVATPEDITNIDLTVTTVLLLQR